MAILLAISTAPATVLATDADSIKALEKKLEQSMRMNERSLQLIEELSAKVKQLEQANATARSSQAAPVQAVMQSVPNEKIDELERQVTQLTSGLSRRSDDAGLPIHGFADVGLGRSSEDNLVAGRQRRGFNVGSFDLYMTPQFGDRVKTLIELIFEVNDGELATDLERLQIGYAFNDAATVWLGRFHTPYGYWNTAFHHGAQIQTSVSRPVFLDFEDKGGILPSHTTGVWLNGGLPLGPGKLGYDGYIGNSPSIAGAAGVTPLNNPTSLSAANPTGFNPTVNAGSYAGAGVLNMQMSGNATHRPSVGYNLWYEPKALAGLRLGLHGLHATVVDDSSDNNRTGLNMLGAYGVFSDENWEVMGEYYRFRNKDISGNTGTHGSSARYLQAGYVIGLYTPYARVESTHLDQRDDYFAVQTSGRSYKRQTVGLRYDVDPKAALKLEYGRTRKTDLGVADDAYSDTRVLYSIRF